jgi:hypothetical protein
VNRREELAASAALIPLVDFPDRMALQLEIVRYTCVAGAGACGDEHAGLAVSIVRIPKEDWERGPSVRHEKPDEQEVVASCIIAAGQLEAFLTNVYEGIHRTLCLRETLHEIRETATKH